jgi:hypothetical protein
MLPASSFVQDAAEKRDTAPNGVFAFRGATLHTERLKLN